MDKLFLASSNQGKLREYGSLVETFSAARKIDVELLPEIGRRPAFAENAPTFAENAAGKALHYSRFAEALVFADDSGLVVPALGGAPGVRSARYLGENATDADRIRKLLKELRETKADARSGYFICVIALARKGRVLAVVSDRAEGEILDAPRGTQGFGYDPVFFFPALKKTFAEQSLAEKNQHSHRAKAFRKLCDFLSSLGPETGVI
jgi:XTP/dITP diphosphohydrolase